MTAEYSGDQGPGSGSKRVKWLGSRYVGNLALFSGTKSERRSATQKSQWSLTALIVAQVTDIIRCCSVPFHPFQAFHFCFQDLLGVRKNTCVGFLTNLLVLFMWKAWWESELGFCRIGFILQISFPLKIKEFCGCLALLYWNCIVIHSLLTPNYFGSRMGRPPGFEGPGSYLVHKNLYSRPLGPYHYRPSELWWFYGYDV